MGNPKKDSKHFVPENLGAKSRSFGGNKGKQMQDTSGKHPQVIQTKGEQYKKQKRNAKYGISFLFLSMFT